jgi:hypothetical protein
MGETAVRKSDRQAEVCNAQPPVNVTFEKLRTATPSSDFFARFERSKRSFRKIFRKIGLILRSPPVIAETLLNEDEQIASRLLRTARTDLLVTSGVIEEVERHINRCRAYTQTPVGQWKGGVPFLFAMFAIGGHAQEGIRFDQ